MLNQIITKGKDFVMANSATIQRVGVALVGAAIGLTIAAVAQALNSEEITEQVVTETTTVIE
jgi:hypothetical protein